MPSERVILITGCSSGIGRAAAIEAAARGHRVFATARNPETLRDLESRGRIRALALDVTDAACASKHALEAFSDALRIEVAPFGIRVAVIEAGPIETRFGDRARASVARLIASPGPYSLFYRNAERAMDTDFQAGKLPPEAVARVVVEAIEAANPKTRYRITRLARALILLKRFLPDRFFDRRMKKVLKLPDRV